MAESFKSNLLDFLIKLIWSDLQNRRLGNVVKTFTKLYVTEQVLKTEFFRVITRLEQNILHCLVGCLDNCFFLLLLFLFLFF